MAGVEQIPGVPGLDEWEEGRHEHEHYHCDELQRLLGQCWY